MTDSEVPQGNQDGHLADTEGVKALSSKADNPGEISDGYHTFNELYEFRLLYNAALWNEWAKQKLYKVHKSWHHADEPHDSIFGKGWFIVVAELPTGQISNHYPPEDWELFQVTETPVAHAWDGHTTADVADRLRRFVQGNDLLAPDSTPPLQPSDAPSNGGGSQDSIDSLEAILHLNGCQQRTAGYGDAKDGKELDMEDMERLEKLTFTEVTAWHNTQLKAESVAATFRMMTEYVDSCNDQSDETDGLAIVPNFKGFKKFLEAKLDDIQSNLEKL